FRVNSRAPWQTESRKIYGRHNYIRAMKTTLTRTLILWLAIVSTSALAGAVVNAQSNPQIIPAPKQVTVSEGSFTLSRDTRVVLADNKSAEDRFAAQDFIDDLKTSASISLSTGGKSRHEILIGRFDIASIAQALQRNAIQISDQLSDEGYVTVSDADE